MQHAKTGSIRPAGRTFAMLVCAVLLTAATALLPRAAEARNVPGSAGAGTLQIFEVPTDMMLNGITETVQKMRRNGGGAFAFRTVPGVGTQGMVGANGLGQAGPLVLPSISTGGSADNGILAAANLQYRDIEIDGEVDGDILTGTLTLGYRANASTMLFGAILGERVDVDTPFNTGRVQGSGYGLALGVDHETGNGWALTATAGAMALDYEFNRSGGAITGAFGAQRQFLDLRGDKTTRIAGHESLISLGLRYVRQSEEGYTEAGPGGGTVAAREANKIVAFARNRTYFPMSATTKAFADFDARYYMDENDDLPLALQPVNPEKLRAGIGIGLRHEKDGLLFEAGVGANFTENGYAGYNARLDLNLRF